MQITPAHLRAGTIVLSESVPSLSIGRSVIATVLSAPKDGSVLVSMFGKRLLVETAIPLEQGQVLNLKVHAVSPKVILKPVPMDAAQITSTLKDIGNLLAGVMGKAGAKEPGAFLVQEIVRQLSSSSGDDAQKAQVMHAIMDQIVQYPHAIAHLLIPLVDNDSRGAARVSVEKEENAYVLNFDMETENLGNLACTARMYKDKGMDVEIRTPSEDIADFLRENVFELKTSLQPFGVRSVEVLRGAVRALAPKEVNVLV
jgi:hypothetical protein